MTSKPQRRDNRYYIERLRVDHPGIHADYLAGKFRTPAEAFVAAGLRKTRTSLDLLRSAWSKASATEQAVFKAEIGCGPVPASTPVSPLPMVAAAVSAPGPVAAIAQALMPIAPGTGRANGLLAPSAKTAIRDIMARRGLTTGDIMREIGFTPLNASLGMALARDTRLKPEMIEALEKWLAANAA